MSAPGQRSFEDILDEALQSLLDGTPLDEVLTRYPHLEAELRPILHIAKVIRHVPHPEMAPSKVAFLVSRAQAQAAPLRVSASSIAEPVSTRNAASSNMEDRQPLALPVRDRGLRPFTPALRIAAVLVVGVLFILTGLTVLNREVRTAQPTVVSVPALTVQASPSTAFPILPTGTVSGMTTSTIPVPHQTVIPEETVTGTQAVPVTTPEADNTTIGATSTRQPQPTVTRTLPPARSQTPTTTLTLRPTTLRPTTLRPTTPYPTRHPTNMPTVPPQATETPEPQPTQPPVPSPTKFTNPPPTEEPDETPEPEPTEEEDDDALQP